MHWLYARSPSYKYGRLIVVCQSMTPANRAGGGGSVVFGLVLMVRVLGRINDLSDPYVTLLVDTSGDPIAAAAAARAVAKSTAAMQRQGM